MKARRKLINLNMLTMLRSKNDDGVPVARLIRDFELAVSLPHLRKLMEYSRLALEDSNVASSLEPPWLDLASPEVQECPDNYKYKGLFPFGAWLENEDNKEVH